jgi:alpha-tubulin suppressor-like RCC1 family protein
MCACGRFGFEPRATPDAGLGSGGLDGDGAIAAGWTRVAAGAETTCGIYKSRAYCWGRGTNNEIGDGNGVDQRMPSEVALPAGTVTDVSQGEGNACAVVDDALYCWGAAAIGNGTPSSATPKLVSGLPANVTSLSAGGRFACAVVSSSLYCWGDDPSGANGNGAGGLSLVPQMVALPSQAVGVDAGNDHTMALVSDGRVFVWGHNDNGVFGNGSTSSPATSEVPVETTAVTGTLPSLGGWDACALAGGGVTCWGTGTRGELGDGQMVDRAVAGPVTGMTSGVTVLAVGGGPINHDAACAARAGVVSCWGTGTNGRLGTGNTSDQTTPQPVQNLPGDVVELALGFEHTCARSSDGTMRCWGRGDLGQLGDGDGADSLTPVVVPLPF